MVQPTQLSVEQRLQRCTAQIDELANRIDELAKRSGELGAENLALKAQNELLASMNTAQKLPPRQVLPAPKTFDGTNWHTWHAYIQAKLDVDGEAIGSSKAQYWFVYGCLEPKVQALIPLASGNEATPNAILAALAVNTIKRLCVMRQAGGESFRAYVARFESTLREAGAQDLPDRTKIFLLHHGLHYTLKTTRVTQRLATENSYSGFVKFLERLSSWSLA